MPKTKIPRVNKTKEQLIAETKHLEKVNREKSLVKLMFPLIENQKTIYDAQTALQALSGFVKLELDKKMNDVKVGDLVFDLSKDPESEIKTSVLGLIDMLKFENAKDTANLLERFGNILAQHSSREYMKQPMNIINIDMIVAK